MSILCKGITLSGTPCNRRTIDDDYCYQHRQNKNSTKQHRETKPSECIICCESLDNQKRSLACGHWIHLECIILSAKAECPICRTKLTVGKRAMKNIEKLAKKRKTETIQAEEDDLRADLQYEVAGLISPALRSRLDEVVENLLEDVDDFDTTTIFFDDETYQSFLHNLMGYDFDSDSEFEDSDF